MTLRVEVTEMETGDTQTSYVADGDYMLLTVGGCHLAHANTYPKAGTHVLTIKDYRPKPLPPSIVGPCEAPGCLLGKGHRDLHDIRSAPAPSVPGSTEGAQR